MFKRGKKNYFCNCTRRYEEKTNKMNLQKKSTKKL